MQRFLYFAGFTYIALCGAILFRESRGWPGVATVRVEHGADAPGPVPSTSSSGAQWFAAMKPYCNAVEVDVRERFTPAPRTSDGAGYAAACFALAGKIDRARTIIEAIPPRDRAAAASVLFNVAHPVADAGDDRASGPMMQLVLEYWPDNYMALYHAGMSEYSLGQTTLAEKHLRAFLGMYNAADGFTSAARDALRKIEERNATDLVRLRRNVERETAPRP